MDAENLYINWPEKAFLETYRIYRCNWKGRCNLIKSTDFHESNHVDLYVGKVLGRYLVRIYIIFEWL
jgi:hypothetical protein